MSDGFDFIAFDADDTLWHTEGLYVAVQARFRQLLAPYNEGSIIDQQLLAAETRNLGYYGYGIKGFALSLIETAIELSDGRIAGGDIRQIIDWTKTMLSADVELIDHARDTVGLLSRRHRLMVLTKGDLFDQQSKIERSGLRPYFEFVEVLSDKTPQAYAAVLERYAISPSDFLMVGNSLRSDILPVVALGGCAVHIPYHLTWAHEHAAPTEHERGRYYELEHLGDLPALVEQLVRRGM